VISYLFHFDREVEDAGHVIFYSRRWIGRSEEILEWRSFSIRMTTINQDSSFLAAERVQIARRTRQICREPICIILCHWASVKLRAGALYQRLEPKFTGRRTELYENHRPGSQMSRADLSLRSRVPVSFFFSEQ